MSLVLVDIIFSFLLFVSFSFSFLFLYSMHFTVFLQLLECYYRVDLEWTRSASPTN